MYLYRLGGSHPHGTFDDSKYYKVKAIIDETATRYHISWEDDEETGESYENTWEPKSNVTADTIAEWEQLKAQQKGLS